MGDKRQSGASAPSVPREILAPQSGVNLWKGLLGGAGKWEEKKGINKHN